MGDNLLRRWFRGPQAAGPEVEDARAELQRLAADRPALLPLLQWLRAVLPDLVPSPDGAPALTVDPERARAKLQGGIPLLRGEQLAVDLKSFHRRWQRACEMLEAEQPDGAAAALAGAVRSGGLDPGEMIESVFRGQPEAVRQRADDLGLDAGLTATLLRFTLFPYLTALESSHGALRAGIDWVHGYCPTCGSWPLLGEFRGLEQTRFLRCGLCAAEWEVPRLWCPYCGSRDHERLGFLHEEGVETKYRAAVCDACRGYVKMVSTLSALSPLHLLVTDAATLHLDLAAAERGYTNHV